MTTIWLRGRGLALACVIVLGASSVSACSSTRTYKQSGGHCVEHKTDRIFGVPVLQDEWNCDDNK